MDNPQGPGRYRDKPEEKNAIKRIHQMAIFGFCQMMDRIMKKVGRASRNNPPGTPPK